MKKTALYMVVMSVLAAGIATACSTDADVASQNLSKAADQFEIARRIVFVNGITDNYLLEITGLCSIEDQVDQLEVTCKLGDDNYKKHFLGLSDNTFYVVEQLEGVDVSTSRYRVTFKPSTLIPEVQN